MAAQMRKIEGLAKRRAGNLPLAEWFAVAAATAVVLIAGVQAAEAQRPRPRHPEDRKRQVEKLEETWRTAQLDGDVETMDRLLSDDYIGITMNGQVATKTQQLDRMRTHALVLTRIQLDDVKVKLMGSTAVVTSRANVEGTNDGNSIQGTYRYTRVYARLPNGYWKITNFEATAVGTPSHPRKIHEWEPSPSAGTSPSAQKFLEDRTATRSP